MARPDSTVASAARSRGRAGGQSVDTARAAPATTNVSAVPAIWTEEQLAGEADRSLNEFVDRRLTEPHTRYAAHLDHRRRALARLFIKLRPIDPGAPDPELIRDIILDDELLGALRYAAGPPISDDDLGILVTRSTRRLTKRAITADNSLAPDILRLICRVADGSRFPWIAAQRPPRPAELRHAITATAAMHASQAMQTERRAYGREVERQLRERLAAAGFLRATLPNRGRVNAPRLLPPAGSFYGECSLYGRRADLLIGLGDGRTVAVEAKDSSSVVNSVKRVLNDTAAKARHWNTKMGEQIVPVALLSGVFGVDTLKAAQASGLFLVWAHDLDSFAEWLSAQQASP